MTMWNKYLNINPEIVQKFLLIIFIVNQGCTLNTAVRNDRGPPTPAYKPRLININDASLPILLVNSN